MNNPFDHTHIQEEKAEREARRLKLRTNLLIALFCGMLCLFFAVLYQAQIVNGASYLSNSDVRDIQSEQVDSVRGEILDTYGRVLVTNEVNYNVELDTTSMGEERNAILERLLDICREQGVAWSDTLPITRDAPWTFTTGTPYIYRAENADGELEDRPTLLGQLAAEYKWREADRAEPTATQLLTAMCETFGLTEQGEVPDQRDRELAGVLYELYLRNTGLNNNTYVFARGVDITFISRVKENALAGVHIETATSRKYGTSYAAHVLGYTGAINPGAEWERYKELNYPMDATVGKEGVELAFEKRLHGVSGTRRIEKDGDGNVVSQEWRREPEPGENVVLTLDIALQATTEDLLAQYAARQEEQKGMAAAVVDMSGGVLALASYPTYDLSTFRENYSELSEDLEHRPLLNRATQGVYAPGSTFKMLTAVAALSEEVITTRDRIECTGRYRFYPNPADQPYCWNTYGHGNENVTDAIKDSCNVFFYDVGRRTTIAKLREYAQQFGLGQYTGIELIEDKGRVAGPETSEALGGVWFEGNTMYAAIGQENNAFTPLQLANYVATLANGGSHYDCHLLKEFKSSDYSRVTETYDKAPRNTIDIDPNHLAAIRQGMYDLSKTYTMAKWFDPLPVEVGCKTGTAETSSKAATTNAIFVCFAPYDDPQVALCLVSEGGEAGGSLAELAAGILAQYFSTGSSLDTVTGENALLR